MTGDARDDDRPWEWPGAVRRDCEPRRGDFLMTLAACGMLCGVLSLCMGSPPCSGFPSVS